MTEDFLNTLPEGTASAYRRFIRANEVIWKEAEPQVGLSPKEVVWKKNKAQLYRYHSTTSVRKKTPLLMIYALINKPYILDLTPGNSLVEYLVNKGYDVFLLDWGTFGKEDKGLTFDDIVMDYIAKAVQKVLKITKAEDISILGYCMGGTLVSIYAALHPHVPIRNLVFMTSPFDFSETGVYGNMLDERYFNLDKLVDTAGVIPPEMLDFGNKMLKPITNFYGPYVSLLDRSENQRFVNSWKLMQKWVADGIPFPGEAYRQWIRYFYRENRLVKGTLTIRGEKVDLRHIKASILNLAANRDHIAMPCQVEGLFPHVSSEDKQYVSIPSGHVSVVFGPTAINVTYPTIGNWLDERSN